MNTLKNKFIIHVILVLTLVTSCNDLDELNINPNGVDPETADLNLLMATIETGIGQSVVGLGFGNIAGVMQHTQKDGWSGGHNDYDWNNQDHSWSGYYGILRNTDEFYQKAMDGEFEFHQGVALVMKSYAFGMIADLWGDAPYSEALLAEDGPENFKPVYDGQKDIYMGIFTDLEAANNLLSGDQDSYSNINSSQDLIYGGDASKWRKLANSIALRYYMRLSAKEPSTAEEGIKRITSDATKYPLITSAADDANISYAGNSPSDSWPSNTVFDTSPSGSYMRIKLCGTLVEVLKNLNDPRLGVWANKIETPLVLVPGTGIDVIVDGKRNISQDIVDDYENNWGVGVDYDPEYVGIPPSVFAAPQYNLNPNLEQGVFNPHASQLNDIYKDASGSLLMMRIMSAAEVHFILSEAALYGWGSGTPVGHYGAGIQQSMNAWGVGDDFDDYIAGAPYSGKESIIQQKWIASWTAAAESWFDYRRTGLPDLQTGESAKREKLPLRFYYAFSNEISLNTANAAAAIEKLEPTAYKGSDVSNNSAWSKSWLLQGTGLPY
ncbi:MAG: SusD/RagB family nutrient-binding outer membrane lipoprotein [Cyclobacteriaceae bacterium]|nr:SusD/RagB family nutrient-binding outer membrane lipoprotein [Cyclobacteriaceae bacterium]